MDDSWCIRTTDLVGRLDTLLGTRRDTEHGDEGNARQRTEDQGERNCREDGEEAEASRAGEPQHAGRHCIFAE